MFGIFLQHLKGYEKPAVFTPILMILEVICELVMPLLMADIVDKAIPSGDVRYIVRLGAEMLCLAGISMACGIGGAKLSSSASQGFGANLRQTIFEKIQTFSFSDIDRFSSASLITRLTNDVNTMSMMLAMGLRTLVRAPVMFLVAIIFSVSLNARLATVLLVVLPFMAVIIGVLMKMSSKLFRLVQSKIDAVNSVLQENLTGIRIVKAFVREDHEKEKFKKRNDDLTDAFIKVGMRTTSMMPIMAVILNLAIIWINYTGDRMVMAGTFTMGDLQAFFNYIGQILMSTMMMGMTFMQLARSQACVKRIREVLNTVPDIEDKAESTESPLPAAEGKIEFRDVSFRYVASGSGDDVLSHLNFTVEPGTFTALVGGTGTGKSSLVNLIPRFYDVTGGAVFVDGRDVRSWSLNALRGRIGMVLQNNVLFSGTIRENLLWGKEDATEEELVQACKNASAYDFIMSFPNGFETHIEQGGVNVSGGQKQRLCIARAMLRHPSILILDDSTSAVDTATEAEIRASFRKNLAGTTVIMIAQRISSVQFADRILVLDDDHIVGEGTHEELLKTCDVYREIYLSQERGVGE